MTINNELLAKFEGKWTEWKLSDLVNGLYNVDYDSLNPSYSTSPADRERLWGYLMGKEEMWKAFKTAILTAKIGEPYDGGIIVYLFSFIDGAPRWVSLLSEWLGMESTREKWGWEECPTCWKPGDYTGSLPMFCPKCNSSGKVLAPWAR